MALPIQGIPTLSGKEARRFRDMADKAERRFEKKEREGKSRDVTQDPEYQMTLSILKKSHLI